MGQAWGVVKAVKKQDKSWNRFHDRRLLLSLHYTLYSKMPIPDPHFIKVCIGQEAGVLVSQKASHS